MATLRLAARLEAGETLYCGWCGLADSLAAEAVARGGFDAVCLDTQHGFQDFRAMREAVTAVAAAGAAPIVRVPYGAFAETGRAIDMGAEAIICPMINNRADAERLVRVMKFPPLGTRSWAPQRVSMLWGLTPDEFLASANGFTLALAMIETADAVANLDEILSVDGIDGVFVGPSDLSISLLGGARIDPFADEVLRAVETIAAKTRDHGKHATIYLHSAQRAPACRELGYRLLAAGSDLAFVRSGAEALAETLRKE